MSPIRLLLLSIVGLSFAAVAGSSIYPMLDRMSDGTRPLADATERPDRDALATAHPEPSFGDLVKAVGISLGGGSMNTVGGSPNHPSDPAKLRRTEFYGYSFRHPSIAAANDEAHMLTRVVSDMPFYTDTPQIPARVETIEPLASCAPRPPEPDETVVNIQVFSGGRPTGLHMFSERLLVEQTVGWVDQAIKRSDSAALVPQPEGRAAGLVNVMLTDRSGPLYLILQSTSGPLVWSLQAAPGVEVAHVVTVGPAEQAIDPGATTAPIDVLVVGDGCAPQPARRPAPHWGLYTQAGASSTRDRFEPEAHERFTAYDGWFRSRFGQSSEDGVIGGFSASHVLAGPLPESPEARLAYRPLNESTVLATPADHVVAGPEEVVRNDLSARATRLAETALGRDLAGMLPEPRERTQ